MNIVIVNILQGLQFSLVSLEYFDSLTLTKFVNLWRKSSLSLTLELYPHCISLIVSFLQGGPLIDSNIPSMVSPLMWPENPFTGNRQNFQQQWNFDALHQPLWGREEENHIFINPENSLLSYDSSANSGRLGSA